MGANDHQESPLQLLGRIVDDVRELFREEVALARAEIRQELAAWSSAGIAVAGGAFAAIVGLCFLLLALAQGLAMLFSWPAWAGYLIVGALLMAIGGVWAQSALKRARSIATLPRTSATIEETSRWVKSRMH